jgi:hypothetical protein
VHLIVRSFYLLTAACLLTGTAWSQDEFVPDKGQSAGETKQDDPQKELKDKIKKFDELLKDATKHEGAFTLYTKTKDGKTDLFIELSPENLGKVFFLQSALQSGANADGLQAGESGTFDLAVSAYRFERADDRIRIIAPNLGWRWSEDNVWAVASRRSFPEGIVETLKIEADNPETKRMIIKATGLFSGGLIDLNDRINKVSGRTYQYDRDNSGISEVQAFPENIVIRTHNFYTSSGGGSDPLAELIAALTGESTRSHLATDKSLPLNITYLLYPKKYTGYEPRVADPRVGYFTQDYFDTTKPLEMDKVTRQILRWDIRKKDPAALMSAPQKPIVFWIDDSVPAEYHKAVSDGILRWNRAFEKIGIKNAVQVQEKPKDATWDHADMRFNVVRMIRSENAGYAVACPRWDPYTGEFLNASISIDAAMLYSAAQEYSWIAAPAVGTYENLLSALVAKPVSTPNHRDFSTPLQCRYGPLKAENASFGLTAMELLHPGIKINRKKYIDQFLEDVVSHEMGHVLGLRHNFVSSAFLSPQQLADPAVTAKEGLTASVMDYTPVNIFAVASGIGDYYSPVLGVYDHFAIEYGYKDIAGGFTAEGPELKKIASRASLPGLRFMTDENADSFDPYVVRFDNSSNPLADADKQVSIAKLLLSKADSHYPKPGRPYSDLTRVVNLAIRQTLQQSLGATRFVGGVRGNRNFAGDPQMKPTLAPVEPAEQRAALYMIARNLFAEDSFVLSPKMLMNLSADPNSERYDPVAIKDIISGCQRAVVSVLLSSDTLSRVANNSFKWGDRKDRFTLTELYGTLTRNIYSEVGTGKEVGVLRRELQRFLTDALATQALSASGRLDSDAKMLAFHHLKTLGGRLQKATSSDEMTRIHLQDLARKVNRALNAVTTIGGVGTPPPILGGGG